MTKVYQKLQMVPIEIEGEMSILEGSVTLKSIKVNTVTVDPYDDGFASDGGFKEITFD